MYYRRIAPEAVCDIRAAICHPGRVRTLFVTVPQTSIDRRALNLECGGIETRLYTLDRRDLQNVAIGMQLRDVRYTDLFSALAVDLVRHLAAIPTIGGVPPALFGHLFRWQQFLKRINLDGLTAEQRRGLFTELHLLAVHIIPVAGGTRATSAWTGPTGAEQDFQFGQLAIEAKSTTGRTVQRLQIASERQLDDAGLDCLLLYVLSLDEREGTPQTLPGIVTGIRNDLAGDPLALDLFESRLLEAGYLVAHEQRYGTTGYTIRREAFFRVSDGFPRILERGLPNGVGGVRYTIGLDGCDPFEMSAGQVHAILTRLAHD
jgi:hypothetical protein